MKLLDILSSLMMDDTYKGRGKYHSKVRRSSDLRRWLHSIIAGDVELLKPVIEFVFRLSEFVQSSGAGDQRAGDGPADRVRELCSLRRSVDSERQERYVTV